MAGGLTGVDRKQIEGTSKISIDWKNKTHRRSIHVFPYSLLMCILKNGTLEFFYENSEIHIKRSLLISLKNYDTGLR